MEFQVGAYVKFIDEVGGGYITKVIDQETVQIELEDGFDVDAKIRSLVIDPSRSKNIVKTVSKPAIKESVKTVSKTINVNASSEKTPINTNVELHFIENKSSFDIVIRNGQALKVKICLFTNQNGKYSLLHEVELFSGSYKEIGGFNPGSCSSLIAEMIWMESDNLHKRPPVSTSIKIKTARFYKNNSFKYRAWLDEKSIVETIYEEENIFHKLSTDNHSFFKEETVKGPKFSKSHKRISTEEIDIHIEELVDDYRQLSNGEIVSIQLDAVSSKIEHCLKHRIGELVVIHGRGSGTLREEVRRLIKSYGLTYSDGSFQKYGAGATLVEFKAQ